MEREKFDALEIEANGYTPPAIIAEMKEKVHKLSYCEQMEELLADTENGQYYGARFPGYKPINITR
jgi:hypothetical protein